MDIISRAPLKYAIPARKGPNMLTTASSLPISNLAKPAPPKKQKATTATYWAAFPPVLRPD